MKYWIQELHFKRFGHVIGEKPLVIAPPAKIEYDPEEARRFEEEMFWDDYYERNADDTPKRRKKTAGPAAGLPAQTQQREPEPALAAEDPIFYPGITDDDVPF